MSAHSIYLRPGTKSEGPIQSVAVISAGYGEIHPEHISGCEMEQDHISACQNMDDQELLVKVVPDSFT